MWKIIGFMEYIIIFQLQNMQGDQSSFRQMYQYPNDGQTHKQRKYMLKGARNKRGLQQTNKPEKQTFYGVVQKAKNVALFARNIKQRIAQKRTLNTHTLKANQLQYLQSDSQEQFIMACFKHDNKVILGIEMVYIACMMLYLWQCTFEIVFGEMPTNQIINGIALLFYIIHIMLFQVTEYKNEKSQLVVDSQIIRDIYWNQRMVKDAIFLLVIMLQLTPIDTQSIMPIFLILRVLSLLSYSEMMATFDKVENLLVRSMESQTILSLIKLLFKLFFFLHLLSSILNLMATIERSFHVPVVWLDNSNFDYVSKFDQYIIGWYWGATIFSTVGFGQIIPANNIQRFIVSFLQIFCCLTFGYYINAIGQIIKMRAESSQKYEKQVRKLNRYLNDLVLTNDLKHKIRTHYFNKHLIEQKHDPNEEKQVLSTITPNLKASLLEEVNMKVVKKCNVFDKFKEQTIKNISQAIKRTILAPQYILYSRNSSDRKMWFIQSGIIEEQTDKFADSKLRKVISLYDEKNPLVGWINFMLPGTYKSIAKAKNFTIAHQLQQSQFIKCLNSDVVEYHKYLEIKHRMIEKHKLFENKCISCGRYTHNVIDCPRIHLVKKDGQKIARQKMELDKFRSSQYKKVDRSELKYNWKLVFGSKQLEKQAYLLNNGKDLGNGTIENYLKKLAFRDSVNAFDRRKASGVMVMVPKDLGIKEGEIRDTNKGVDANDRSLVSFDSQDQEGGVEFEKAFYNKDLKSYMPQNDIQIVLHDYHKKIVKKKLDSSKNLAKTSKN